MKLTLNMVQKVSCFVNMIKEKIFILFCLSLFLFSCQQDQTPKGIIEKEKMINVMVDFQITDSYLNQIPNQDTMKMQAHTRYNYIFKKYDIDSATFSRSLSYYSRQTEEFNKMFDGVLDSLNKMESTVRRKDSLINIKRFKADSINKVKVKINDSLINVKRIKTDSAERVRIKNNAIPKQ